MSHVAFTSDLRTTPEPLAHVWEHTVGSGHATLALRADWQAQLARCHRELGFGHVRFHGILSDDLGTLVCEEDALVKSFFNADRICDYLVSIGMSPFVELSFMPAALSSGNATVFHYAANVTPPKDVNAWARLIESLVRHWVDRYGLARMRDWLFEVWNEPNLDAFWKGTRAQYFELYDATARAIKRVAPSLRVGGPATAMNAWIDELVSHCDEAHVPIDFISTHHYPTDAFGSPGDDTRAQLTKSRRSVLRDEAEIAKGQSRGKPLYYTEWCTSSNPFDDLHDEPYAAAFAAKTVMEAAHIVEGYSYWTFTDIFEENYFSSKPFHGGFGLMNVYGVPKPVYRAFEMLHKLGDELFVVDGEHATVDAWVTRGDDGRIAVLLTNGALPAHRIRTEHVSVRLRGVKRGVRATLERIDKHHANAKHAWVERGRPDTLDARDVRALERASRLVPHPLAIARRDGEATFELDMPPQSAALVVVAEQ
jgi:xylan 1,4-beta-xylosidase